LNLKLLIFLLFNIEKKIKDDADQHTNDDDDGIHQEKPKEPDQSNKKDIPSNAGDGPKPGLF
jgi:hypothetical protein